MAPRASWKGHLKLSLVSCPVLLYTATSRSDRVSFRQLHKDTHNRIQLKPHDPELGEVDRSDLVKGYEYEKDHYVILEAEDFEKLETASDHTLSIEQFVDENDVDPIFLDSPYYLAPDGVVAEETFRVVHEAMRQKKKVALGRIVMSNREHLVSISVKGKGFLVTTLRTADEVREHETYFKDISDEEPEKGMLGLAGQLIEQNAGKFDPSTFKDQYQEALVGLIKAKLKGEQPVITKAPERGKVINLMDALKHSLEERGPALKPPAESKRRKVAGEKDTRKKKRA